MYREIILINVFRYCMFKHATRNSNFTKLNIFLFFRQLVITMSSQQKPPSRGRVLVNFTKVNMAHNITYRCQIAPQSCLYSCDGVTACHGVSYPIVGQMSTNMHPPAYTALLPQMPPPPTYQESVTVPLATVAPAVLVTQPRPPSSSSLPSTSSSSSPAVTRPGKLFYSKLSYQSPSHYNYII